MVGGDRLDYLLDASSPAANMLDTKILLNSIISDAKDGVRFMTLDLKDFFLYSTMPEAEYMRIPWKHVTNDIAQRYNLKEKLHNVYVYVKINKGMYGLKQAAVLAYNEVKNHLKTFGYIPIEGSPTMFKHITRPTKFCLCVDDFGIKYYSEDDANHLKNALFSKYKGTCDMSGKSFCGFALDWNYKDGYVDISMSGYVKKALQKLQYKQKNPPSVLTA